MDRSGENPAAGGEVPDEAARRNEFRSLSRALELNNGLLGLIAEVKKGIALRRGDRR